MQAFSRAPRRAACNTSCSQARKPGGQCPARPLKQSPAAAQLDAAPTSSTASSSSIIPTSTSTSATSSLRLPATHQESSRRALEQLKASSVNRKSQCMERSRCSEWVGPARARGFGDTRGLSCPDVWEPVCVACSRAA